MGNDHWTANLKSAMSTLSGQRKSEASDEATTTTVLQPFVWDYPGEPVPEETLTHPPSISPSNLYQLLPSTMIHSIIPVQIMCLAIFMRNLSPHTLWSTSWSRRETR